MFASASEATATWRFTNFVLYYIIVLNTDISQGSVATRLGCVGVFVYDLVTNFLLSLTVKEF